MLYTIDMLLKDYLTIIDGAVQRNQMKKNYENYKLDCLLLKKIPMSYNQFKKKYENKTYQEENIF